MAYSNRKWMAAGVIIAWGATLGWLGLRNAGQSEASLLRTSATLRLSPADVWFGVWAGPVQTGAVGVTLDTLSPGYRILETVSMELRRDSTLARANRTTEYILGPTLALDSITSRLGSVGRRRYEALNRESDGYRFLTASESDTTRGASIGDLSPVPWLVLPYRLALTGALATADPRRLDIAGGHPMAVRSTSVRVGDQTTAIFPDSSEQLPGSSSWTVVRMDTVAVREVLLSPPSGPVSLRTDNRGTLVSLEFPLGVRWERTDFSIALIEFRNRLDQNRDSLLAQLPVLERLAVPGRMTDTTTAESRWYVQRRDGSAIRPALLRLFGGGRQEALPSGDGFLILPFQDVSGGSSGDDGTDPLIQSDDAGVSQLAVELGASITSGDWDQVATVIRRRVTVDTSTGAAEDAAGALAAGRGSPDGIARLLVAVVRAAGGNARYAVGVLPRGGRMFTHAWAEVRRPGSRSWLSVDPVFGRGSAGTGLLRLASAGSSHPDDMLPMVADVIFQELPFGNTLQEQP